MDEPTLTLEDESTSTPEGGREVSLEDKKTSLALASASGTPWSLNLYILFWGFCVVGLLSWWVV